MHNLSTESGFRNWFPGITSISQRKMCHKPLETRVSLYDYVLCLILLILMLIPYDSGLQKAIKHKGKKRFWGHFCTVSGRVEGETQFTERRWF